MPNTIVYLLYGSRREYHLELTYSVLSVAHFLRRDPADIDIALITTKEGRRDDLPVRHIFVDDDELRGWMLGGAYNHAAKYGALVRAMDEFQGRVILVDTDTYLTQHPRVLFDRIGTDRSLMCDNDALIGDIEDWAPLLAKTGQPVAGYPINAQSRMFNSGVVGVDWSLRSRLSDVYELMSELYSIAPIFNVEQFAFSTVLDAHTSLSVCPDAVRHYWGFDRRFVHAQIDELFPTFSREAFERHVGTLRHLGIPRKPLLDRIRAKAVRLLRGGTPLYGFAYLSYLCALSSSDDKIAEAWASTSLDALALEGKDRSRRNPRHLQRDFHKFYSERLETQRWMRLETRQRWQKYWNELTQ